MEDINKKAKGSDEVESVWKLEWIWIILKTQIQKYKINIEMTKKTLLYRTEQTHSKSWFSPSSILPSLRKTKENRPQF